ncbi:MAG: PIN domain-containing protein [Treponemataceae bacterium]|nr:PIN domain-containing protein [Treponemataceae bacterium]
MSLKVFFDTNEIISIAVNRNSTHKILRDLFDDVIHGKLKGYVTGHSLTDFFYVTRREIPKEDRLKFLLMIANNFTILTEPNDVFLSVLSDSDFFDLEDGLQMQCAEDAVLDYIVTENTEHFRASKVKALTAEEFYSLRDSVW